MIRTVMEEAELAFEHIFELQANLERMNQQLADRTDYESEEYHQLIDRFTHGKRPLPDDGRNQLFRRK